MVSWVRWWRLSERLFTGLKLLNLNEIGNVGVLKQFDWSTKHLLWSENWDGDTMKKDEKFARLSLKARICSSDTWKKYRVQLCVGGDLIRTCWRTYKVYLMWLGNIGPLFLGYTESTDANNDLFFPLKCKSRFQWHMHMSVINITCFITKLDFNSCSKMGFYQIWFLF